MNFKRVVRYFALLLALLLFPLPLHAQGTTEALKQADVYVQQALESAKSGDFDKAKMEFMKFYTSWFTFEEGIKETSKDAYREIEDLMGQIQFAFAQNPVNRENVLSFLAKLKQTNHSIIEGTYGPNKENTPAKGEGKDVGALVQLLEHALKELDEPNVPAAKEDIELFRQSWLSVEGTVLTQSQKVYEDTEKDMVAVYALLSANPPNTDEAKQMLGRMRDYLAPLAGKTTYTFIDATSIILREGLEALLVIIALLGFLQRSGHREKTKWIWSGVTVGLLVSIVLGVIVQVMFSTGAFGQNNFLIAGWTGLFAAVMLLYMSYWLHSKANIAKWQQYIRDQSNRALATGSLVSLALLSFLAVFREGTETVLFFIGLASSIHLYSLFLGIGLGIALLILLAVLILKVGLKIPMRPFFLISSALVFYLCFKFTGMGIRSMQLAGLLPATYNDSIPTVNFLAVYPTWESTVPQLILFFAAVTLLVKNRSLKLSRPK
ncbi:FTR1 family iron permease [Ferviditalea candida]|uniref:FTR1 family protein n=1 Tax=Ferviditalea candida TaxID=3108399 RepID=A0ABU5ZFJ9_9BACL|nr:FTR1 family protein [Paenibacillaceae bacterium T2]